MTLRPPRAHRRRSQTDPLDYEIAQEQALALGRLGRALEVALATLAEYDRALRVSSREEPTAHTDSAATARSQLVQQAAYTLWCFIIQREVCGLRDQRLVMRDYGVPSEVQNRMGVFATR
jgi:hypothetical protein